MAASPDRHFDLNASIAEAKRLAEGEGDVPDPWVTFDLGPNFVAPREAEDARTDDERRQPWRANVIVAGWLVMEHMAAETYSGRLRTARALLENAIDPQQWDQFLAVLKGTDPTVPLETIDYLVNQISRVQIGLPLDRS